MSADLNAIKARWAAATPGPWALDPGLWSPPSWGETMHYRRVVHGEPNEISGIRQPIFSTNGATDGSEQAAQNHHDAAAVAHAPEDIAALIQALEEVRDALTPFTDHAHRVEDAMDVLERRMGADWLNGRGDSE